MPLIKHKVYKSYSNNLETGIIFKNLMKQKAEGIFCDVKLCIQGSVMWGHACMLAPFSAYIMERFYPKTDSDSLTNHQCSQKPLVVDLDLAITEDQDKCAVCLSKIVNFMYSQDLVILEDHIHHFIKILHYLQIVDLIPLFEQHFCDEILKPLIKEPNVKEIGLDPISGKQLLSKRQSDMQRSVTNVNKESELSVCNISELKNENHEEKAVQGKDLNNLRDNCDKNKKVHLESQTFVTSSFQNCDDNVESIIGDHNYGSRDFTLKQKCEFLCCSDEDAAASTAKKHYRRKISCDICSYTVVSVKKLLKHIEKLKHFGKMCPICSLKYQNVDGLQQHLKDHDHSKPYFCQFCHKRNKFWEFHKVHLKAHCRNKNFSCKICHKSFKTQQNLVVHLKTHNQNYLCGNCNYLTSDPDTFKSHLLIHEDKVSPNLENPGYEDKLISDKDLTRHETAKQFLCSLCGQGFTNKSNLKRHAQSTHSGMENYNCSKCTYVTKRTDLLTHHMKKHHNCLPEKVVDLLKKIKKKKSKALNVDKNPSEIVGVLIPVQLMSTNDSSTLDAYAVKTSLSGEPGKEEVSTRKKLRSDEIKSDGSFTINISSLSKPNNLSPSQHIDNSINCTENGHGKNVRNIENAQSLPGTLESNFEKDSSRALPSSDRMSLTTDLLGKDKNFDGNLTQLHLNLNTGNGSCNKNIEFTKPVISAIMQSQEIKSMISLDEKGKNNNTTQDESNILVSGGFWLNEATGELLNENSILNVQVIDTSCRLNTVTSTTDNTLEDVIDPLHTLLFSDTSKTVSLVDIREDMDDFQSNPQTPQTNIVEVEDPDNLFPWSCLDSSFCSTWVLNEATGELNMVSFNIQPIKNSDESNLDENKGAFTSNDDDETALFLNEGTGDLSVIYFNPSKKVCDDPIYLCSEKENQDIPDNISEHSNDEVDLLSEEFFKATASFMAHKENETFLNELTGEFYTSIADLNNCHPELLENQISCSESYLNEETGEISWNILNNNINTDFFMASDSFKYDPDDSLNCDDFDPFPDEMNNFPSQFCLEVTNNWHSMDETCDLLLNECTGELMRKS